ncbi:MAG TPA: hypothetical protein VM287_06590 [Egibacteraceae bacterium]|nr:hypothetical protein [Egibacteraceae bacterium]
MQVSDERLTAVLTRGERRPPRAYDRNPVAGLLVESMAISHDEHADAVRDAGTFLLDLLRANEPGTAQLTLSIAMQVLACDEVKPVDEICCYLARTARKDVLLGIAVHALVGGARDRRARGQCEREVILRTLFLLLRMFEAQEEADELDRQMQRG